MWAFKRISGSGGEKKSWAETEQADDSNLTVCLTAFIIFSVFCCETPHRFYAYCHHKPNVSELHRFFTQSSRL
jgi:hypothetical protein